mmetsp:Transcript_28967/g.72244  ORF Transcript_28967/g.72244 Transcript_28967/m.72244 type:complete len:272 (-) Transcript_28967:13-828(-)
MHTLVSPMCAPASRHTASDCIASSRVGASTSTRASPLAPCGGGEAQCIIAGRKKASVLPEPVSATPTTSRRAMITGQHAAWIGVGLSKAAQARSTAGENPASAKEATGRKAAAPTPVISMRCCSQNLAAAAGAIISTGEAASPAGGGSVPFGFFADGAASSPPFRFDEALASGSGVALLLASLTVDPSCRKMGRASFSAKIFAAFFLDFPASTRDFTTLSRSVSTSNAFCGAFFSASRMRFLQEVFMAPGERGVQEGRRAGEPEWTAATLP